MGQAATGKGCVTVAYVHPGQVDGSFHESIVRLLLADHTRETPRILQGGGTIGMNSGPRIAQARNELVQQFMGHPFKPEWLLMVDTDMVFGPEALDKLLEAAHPKDRPIVGGLCFGGGRSGKVFPTLYRLRQAEFNQSPIEIIEEYPPDALCKVDATGAAFLLMHRDALLTIGTKFKGEAPWFCEGTALHGFTFGEDWAFCLRAKACDIPIYVHTGVSIGHTKPHVLDENAYRMYQAERDVIGDGGLAQRHIWRFGGGAIKPPTYVVIPFKGKHEMTRHLVQQLAGQGSYDRIFLMNNGPELCKEDAAELEAFGSAEVWEAEGMNIHAMWNEGLALAQKAAGDAPFNIAFLNNDLRISDRFLERLALALRADEKLWVVSPRYDDRPERGVQYVSGTAGGGGMAGFAFMVKGEAFAHGLPKFDENLQWWYGDDDFVLNVAKCGHRVGLVLACPVEHLDGGSKTSGDTSTPEWQEVILKDRAYLCQKHGLVDPLLEEAKS